MYPPGNTTSHEGLFEGLGAILRILLVGCRLGVQKANPRAIHLNERACDIKNGVIFEVHSYGTKD
jgi:hypothetical protein